MYTPPLSNSYLTHLWQKAKENPSSLTHLCSASAATITYVVTRALLPTEPPTSTIDLQNQLACRKSLIFLNYLKLLPKTAKHLATFTRKQYQSIYDTLIMFAPKISAQLPQDNNNLNSLLTQIKKDLANTNSNSFEFPSITDDLYAALRNCWYLMLRDAALNGILAKEHPSFPDFLGNHPKLKEVSAALQKGAQTKSTWLSWIPITAATTVAIATEAALCILQSDTDTREQFDP